MNDIFDRLPKACPTCGSTQPTTYYGSCFDNQHSTIFDPRLPMDPWHSYIHQLDRSLKEVESLTSQRNVYLQLLAERDERIKSLEAADVDLLILTAILLDRLGGEVTITDSEMTTMPKKRTLTSHRSEVDFSITIKVKEQ